MYIHFGLYIEFHFLDTEQFSGYLTMYNETNLLTEVVSIFVAFKVRASGGRDVLSLENKGADQLPWPLYKQMVASFWLNHL